MGHVWTAFPGISSRRITFTEIIVIALLPMSRKVPALSIQVGPMESASASTTTMASMTASLHIGDATSGTTTMVTVLSRMSRTRQESEAIPNGGMQAAHL